MQEKNCKKSSTNRIKYENDESFSHDSADASNVRVLCHKNCIYNHWNVFFESVSEFSDAENMFLNIESMLKIFVLSECAFWLSETYSFMRRETNVSIFLV